MLGQLDADCISSPVSVAKREPCEGCRMFMGSPAAVLGFMV